MVLQPPAPTTPSSAGAIAAPPARGIGSLAAKYGGLKVTPVEDAADSVLDILLTGEKHASKTTQIVGIPVKKGKRHFLAFDKRTEEGLENFYGKGVFKQNKVWPLVTAKGDYPGFDPTKPWTAEVVFGNAALALEAIEKQGDGDVIVLEHLQFAYERIARSLIVHENGLDPMTEKIDWRLWSRRSTIIDGLVAKARAIASVATVFTGYGDEERDVMVEKTPEEVQAEKKAGKHLGKTKLVRKVVTPRWVNVVNRDQGVWVHSSITKETEGEDANKRTITRYWDEVLGSKNNRFPDGLTVEITNTNMGVFFDKPTPEVLEARRVADFEREARFPAMEEAKQGA